MQMQPRGPGAGLVAADDAEALTARAAGKVQIGSVLDRQHRALAAHALDRALAVRRKDRVDINPMLRCLLDEAIKPVHRGAVAATVAADRLARILRQQRGALHKAFGTLAVSQACPSELVPRPIATAEPLAQPQRRRMIDVLNPEVTAPLAVQFIDIDPFL